MRKILAFMLIGAFLVLGTVATVENVCENGVHKGADFSNGFTPDGRGPGDGGGSPGSPCGEGPGDGSGSPGSPCGEGPGDGGGSPGSTLDGGGHGDGSGSPG